MGTAWEWIADIPDVAVLRHENLDGVGRVFGTAWGQPPDAYCIPVICADGVIFDNDLDVPTTSTGLPTEGELGLRELCRHLAGVSRAFYISSNLTLPFGDFPHLSVLDNSRDPSSQVCIANEGVQSFLGSLLNRAGKIAQETLGGKSLLFRGFVFDVANLWPMGSAGGRLELTCFCDHCKQQLTSVAGNLDLDTFLRPGVTPFHLLLRDSGTGISPINSVRRDTGAEEILGLSTLHGFDKEIREALKNNRQDMLHAADQLRSYIHARSTVVTQSLGSIFDNACAGLGGHLDRVVLSEEDDWGWTSGLLLDDLREAEEWSEVWLPPGRFLDMGDKPFRYYLWRRARYLIDALFDVVGTIRDKKNLTRLGLGRLTKDLVAQLLELRCAQALSGRMQGKYIAKTLSHPETCRGCVVPHLTEDVVGAVAESARIGPTYRDLSEGLHPAE